MPKTEVLNLDLEKVATNLNYLISTNGCKTLIVVSEMKGEGKTTFITAVSPLLNSIYSKRILIVNREVSQDDEIKNILRVKASSSCIKETGYKGVDYFGISSDNSVIGLEESVDFYDLILINTITKRKTTTVNIPDMKIDGAILIRSKATLNNEEGDIVKTLLDSDIPILGVLYNGGL